MNTKYKPGDVINGFTLIKVNSIKGKHIYWENICTCGDILITRIDNILKKKGCCCTTNRGEVLKLNESNRAICIAYSTYKNKAISRGYSWELSIKDFYNLITKNCHYCGSTSTNKVIFRDQSFEYNGIDRVDNTCGYSVINCVSCCKDCNRAKSDMTLQEFKEWSNRLYSNLNNISDEKTKDTTHF